MVASGSSECFFSARFSWSDWRDLSVAEIGEMRVTRLRGSFRTFAKFNFRNVLAYTSSSRVPEKINAIPVGWFSVFDFSSATVFFSGGNTEFHTLHRARFFFVVWPNKRRIGWKVGAPMMGKSTNVNEFEYRAFINYFLKPSPLLANSFSTWKLIPLFWPCTEAPFFRFLWIPRRRKNPSDAVSLFIIRNRNYSKPLIYCQ